MSEFATVGPIALPDHCDECGDPTTDSAICGPCAWNRYYDQLDEWWDNNPLGGEAS